MSVAIEHDLISEYPEHELSAAEISTRDKFVAEYLVDYNYYNAALRVGFQPGTIARTYAEKFSQDIYVKRKIQERQLTYDEVNNEDVKNRIVSGLMREAHYFGADSTQSARVAAFGKLASIYQMDRPKEDKSTGDLPGGVMAIPLVGSADAWEELAKTAQAELKNSVKD